MLALTTLRLENCFVLRNVESDSTYSQLSSMFATVHAVLEIQDQWPLVFLQTTRRQALQCLSVHVKHAKVVDNTKRVIIWSTDTDVAVVCPRTFN